MKNTNDFSKVKVGDKLWSIQLGDCEVVENNGHAVLCKNLNSKREESYWYSGKQYREDAFQSLFFSNPNIVAPEAPVQLPDLKVNAKVMVWEDGDEHAKSHRYFSHFDPAGRICCFDAGTTSFSVERRNGIPFTCEWSNYEIVEE